MDGGCGGEAEEEEEEEEEDGKTDEGDADREGEDGSSTEGEDVGGCEDVSALSLSSSPYVAASGGGGARAMARWRGALMENTDEITSSGLHTDMSRILGEVLGVPHDNEVVTQDGISIDIQLKKPGYEHYAIEVDGPHHYVRDVTTGLFVPHATTTYKRRMLEGRGWRVVSIPFYDIIRRQRSRIGYLRRKMREIGVIKSGRKHQKPPRPPPSPTKAPRAAPANASLTTTVSTVVQGKADVLGMVQRAGAANETRSSGTPRAMAGLPLRQQGPSLPDQWRRTRRKKRVFPLQLADGKKVRVLVDHQRTFPFPGHQGGDNLKKPSKRYPPPPPHPPPSPALPSQAPPGESTTPTESPSSAAAGGNTSPSVSQRPLQTAALVQRLAEAQQRAGGDEDGGEQTSPWSE
mmetsp:Transcript_25183/g.72712  ORF Transcript_25183/g.72712 Transcript_25183/m.72712 type:complete len:405 (-) Transcript_25183:336-1550(-)